MTKLERMKVITVSVLPLLLMVVWLQSQYSKQPERDLEHWFSIEQIHSLQDHRESILLNFKVNFGTELNCDQSGSQCLCLKVDRSIQSYPRLSQGTLQLDCNQAEASCRDDGYIRGECEDGKFVTGLGQYQIDKSLPDMTSDFPSNLTVRVALGSTGAVIQSEVFVGSLSLNEWLKVRHD